MTGLSALDETKQKLQEQFPGWRIWYVLRTSGPATWCAQPLPLINSTSPEHLAADITQAHEEAAAEWPALASRPDYAVSAPGITQARTETGCR